MTEEGEQKEIMRERRDKEEKRNRGECSGENENKRGRGN